MRNVKFHKKFQKEFLRLDAHIQSAFSDRLKLFLTDPKAPLLRDHALKGGMDGKRSFSITGDIRVIYSTIDEHYLRLERIGTHSQLYG